MRVYATIFSLCLTGNASAVPTHQGEFIFFQPGLINGKCTSGIEPAWTRLKKFRLLLTNGYATFPPDRVKALHKSGGRLFFYFWFGGFYEWEAEQSMPDGNWRRELLERHREWLLNPRQPEKGAGAVQPAYFYDLNRPSLCHLLADAISAHRRATGYDGVFLDMAGSGALPRTVLRRFQESHPQDDYDAAGARFLQAIRDADPKTVIFTNQAHRAGKWLLPFTDIDADESLATSFLWGHEIKVLSQTDGWTATRETYYRPWDGPSGLMAYYTDILAKVRRYSPKVRFLTINYLKAFWRPTGEISVRENQHSAIYSRCPDRPAIFYGYVAAKLFGFDSYSSDWYDAGCFDDEIFWIDLGPPRGTEPEERKGIAVRYYDNGFVVLTTAKHEGVFDVASPCIPSAAHRVWDVYERCVVPDFESGRRVSIKATVYPVSGSTYPAGRVYCYMR